MSDGIDMSSARQVLIDKHGKRVEVPARVRADMLREQQEHSDFVRWLETIEQAKSPSDLDNFLMREMAKNLTDGDSAFTPDRLVRAFEMMHRHGDRQGRIALEKRDAELAREMARQDRSQQMPANPNNKPK